jgi:hypothetical protein
MTACLGKIQSHALLIYVVLFFSLRPTPLLALIGEALIAIAMAAKDENGQKWSTFEIRK